MLTMELPEKDRNILLVDDEEDIRDVLSVSLEDFGYEVYTAENGQEALEIYKEKKPSMVLTDIKMPLMDGIELLKEIKKRNPETEVVMITGHGDMELAIKSLKHEATDFITKPINVEALEISLKRAAERIVVRQKLKEYTENLERLIREKTELQDHLSSLGLMIGTISHSIKGMLTGLDGGMYMVESGMKKKNEERLLDGWQTVKLVVDRIRKMVLDILYYAKKRELQWEKVDAVSFAEEVARAVAPKMEQNGIEFECQFSEEAGHCKIDQGYVHAALGNILENAVDAVRKNGPEKPPKIVFRLKSDAENIVFTVQDNGVGMDDDAKQKLFSRFYSSKGREGTGLGLFISHEIVSQHGGQIIVNSAPGKGASFSIRIPKEAGECTMEKTESP